MTNLKWATQKMTTFVSNLTTDERLNTVERSNFTFMWRWNGKKLFQYVWIRLQSNPIKSVKNSIFNYNWIHLTSKMEVEWCQLTTIDCSLT